METEKKPLTLEQAAQLKGMPYQQFYYYLNKEDCPIKKVPFGGVYAVYEDEVLAWNPNVRKRGRPKTEPNQ